MELETRLRISPVVWLAPFLIPFVMWYTARLPGTSEPYPLALTAEGAFVVFLVAPVCAACAAWEGGRLRRARWVELPHVRSPLMVAGEALLPVYIVGFLAVLAAVMTELLGMGVLALPDLRVIAITFAIIAAHALLGFAIGLHTPPVVAVPTMLLATYSWLALPHALEPPWLRHLNGAGTWLACCSLATDLAPQVSTAIVVVAIGIASSAILLLRRPIQTYRYALAIAPIVVAFVVGASLVRGFDRDPGVARASSLLMCVPGRPQVCVWPEHRSRLQEVSEIAASAAKRWQEVGIAVPDTFTEGSTSSPNERRFGFSLASQRSDIIGSLAYSLLPPGQDCTFDKPPPYPGAPYAEDYLLAWFATTAGMSQTDLASHINPDVLATVVQIQSLPSERQRAWLEQNVAAMRACDWPPQLEASQ
mgnify:CR=1 FL=1